MFLPFLSTSTRIPRAPLVRPSRVSMLWTRVTSALIFKFSVAWNGVFWTQPALLVRKDFTVQLAVLALMVNSSPGISLSLASTFIDLAKIVPDSTSMLLGLGIALDGFGFDGCGYDIDVT